MALVTITVQGTPLYLDENNVLMVYSVGSTIKIDYYDAKSLNVKTVKVSESIATIKAATTSLIELTDLNSSDAFLINKDIISLVEANGSGSKVVLDYKGRDKLISVTENKAAIDLLITPVEYPLIYKALVSTTYQYADTGLLVIGRNYVIPSVFGADDFTNVGYVSDGVPFIATGTTPTAWTNATKVNDVLLNQPTEIIELVNTCGVINVSWYYDDLIYGNFALKITQTGLFLEDKFFAPYLLINGSKIERIDDDNVIINIAANSLSKFPIEFEIYP